jgi:hypothetical protein
MTSHNANNERIKRRYFAYLKEAKRHSEPTVDAVAKALARFEADTKHRDFEAFHFKQAIAFKRHLAKLAKALVRETRGYGVGRWSNELTALRRASTGWVDEPADTAAKIIELYKERWKRFPDVAKVLREEVDARLPYL